LLLSFTWELTTTEIVEDFYENILCLGTRKYHLWFKLLLFKWYFIMCAPFFQFCFTVTGNNAISLTQERDQEGL